MVKKALILFLVFVMSFQAIAVTSDMHESNKTEKHIKSDLGFKQAPGVEHNSQISDQPVDCHHCGHCHGSHMISLLPPGLILAFMFAKELPFNLNKTVKSTFLSQLFRPPQV